MAFFVMVAVVASYLFKSDAKVIERERVDGKITEIHHLGEHPLFTVELADGRTARVSGQLGISPSEVGVVIPLIVTKTDDGRSNARIDTDTWLER